MGPEALGSQGHSEPATQEPGGELRPRLGQNEPAGQGLQLSSEMPPGERDPHAGISAPENRDLLLLGSGPSTRTGTELVPWASGLEVALAGASLRAPLAFCRQSPTLGTAYPGGVAWTRAHSRETQRPRPATLLLLCASAPWGWSGAFAGGAHGREGWGRHRPDAHLGCFLSSPWGRARGTGSPAGSSGLEGRVH